MGRYGPSGTKHGPFSCGWDLRGPRAGPVLPLAGVLGYDYPRHVLDRFTFRPGHFSPPAEAGRRAFHRAPEPCPGGAGVSRSR